MSQSRAVIEHPRPAAAPAAAASGPASARPVKLAEKVARQIMVEMREMGWPVGKLLGTECELIKRYKVSRATLGEAIRQVEMQGAAHMQRGPRGGLVISAPARDAIVKTIASYLDFEDVSLHELFEAFQVIESHSVLAAARNARPVDVERLRALVADIDQSVAPQVFNRRLMAVRLAVADATGNPAIVLFMRVLVRVLTHLVWRNTLPPETVNRTMIGMRNNIAELVEAIAAGNGTEAQRIIRSYLAVRGPAIDKLIREQRKAALARIEARGSGDQVPGGAGGEGGKAADRVARAIIDDIRHDKIDPGAKIGQENELMERYGVSRWVVRQAIRMLEVHSVLRSKRGKGGGLAVTRPDPEYAIAAAESYLSAIEMQPEPFADLWFSLLTNVAQLAAERATPASIAPLREQARLAAELTFEDLRAGLPNYYFALADVANNKVFRLIMMIIARYLNNFKVRVSGPHVPAEMLGLLQQIAEAVGRNEVERAGDLMQRYVAIVRDYIQFVPVLVPAAEAG